MKVSRNLCTKIDETAESKGLVNFTMDGQEVPTSIEPFQWHQRDACLNVVGSKMEKCMHEIWNYNEEASNSDIRMNLTINGFIRAIDK